jgi:pilus assembly protein Flp/PilA
MPHFLQRIANRKDEQGASAVEYGLLVAAIAALIVVIVFALGGVVSGVFQKTCSEISTKSGVAAADCVKK